MRKVLFGIFALVMLSASIFAQSDIANATCEVLQARYLQVNVNAQREMIAMNATVSYLGSQNVSTAQLETIRSQFTAKLSDLKADADACDATHFSLIRDSMRSLALNFRDMVNASDYAHDGGLHQAIQDALQANAGSLEASRNTAWANSKTAALHVFDVHAENAHRIIDQMASHGQNVTEMQAVLDDIEAKKPELEAAYNARNRTQVVEVQKVIKQLYQDFRKDGVTAYAGGLSSLFSKMQDYINKAAGQGANVSAANATLAQMNQELVQLQSQCTASGDSSECRESANRLRNEFINLREQVKQAIRDARDQKADEKHNKTDENSNRTHDLPNASNGNGTGNGSGNRNGGGNP